MRVAAATVVIACAAARPARAGGLERDVLSPRAVGRAGADLVAGDGGAALLVAPAGLARRDDTRAGVGVAIVDGDSSYRALAADAPKAPTVTNLAPAASSPLVSVAGRVGPVVVGAVYLEEADIRRLLPVPSPSVSAADVTRLYPYRYAGTSLRFDRQTVAVGAAARVAPWLGLGVAVTASRVQLAESREIWAGVPGRDTPGDPGRDLALSVSGSDSFVPGAVASALIAPPQLPLEFAVAVSATATAHLDGTAALTRPRGVEAPTPQLTSPTAALSLPTPIAIRAGVRYLGDRVIAELDGELNLLPGGFDNRWSLGGVAVHDQSGSMAEISAMTPAAQVGGDAAVRASADAEIVPGFVWLTAGYAFESGAGSPDRLSPIAAATSAHIIAGGAEVRWGNVTLTLGYARTLSAAVTVGAEATAVKVITPFGSAGWPAAAGRHDRAADTFAAVAEMAWP